MLTNYNRAMLKWAIGLLKWYIKIEKTISRQGNQPVILLHDNAHPHVANIAKQMFIKLK